MSTDPRIASTLTHVAKVLDGIEHRPRMYAQHPEALEASVFHLVGMRQRLLGHHGFDEHEALAIFTAKVTGAETSLPLYAILRERGQLGELPRLLGDFARWVGTKWPAKVTRAARSRVRCPICEQWLSAAMIAHPRHIASTRHQRALRRAALARPTR